MDRIDTLGGARALRLAALAVALALASPAHAATKTAAPAAPAAKATVSDVPLPPPPRLQPRPPATAAAASPAPGRLAWFGGSVGALNASNGKGILAQLDYGILRTPTGWDRFSLEWHVVASFSGPSGEKSIDATATPPIGPPIPVNGGKEKVDALLFEVVPTARVIWTATPGVGFFGDAGLGLVQTFESYDRSEIFMGHSTHNEYATGLVLHLGVGLAAEVAPRWRVMLAPLAFDLMVGPKFSSWTPTLGVAYRL